MATSGLVRVAALALTLGLCAWGAWSAWESAQTFSGTAGAQERAPDRWPASSAVKRSTDRPTLLVFAHPFCSCTRASLDELAKVLERQAAKGGALPDTRVVFFRPSAEWTSSDLWRSAATLPQTTVQWDEGGAEARLFRAHTSGQALLYGADGRLWFQGGVTEARGHEGDNYGAEQLGAALRSGRPVAARSLVFGCSLTGDER